MTKCVWQTVKQEQGTNYIIVIKDTKIRPLMHYTFFAFITLTLWKYLKYMWNCMHVILTGMTLNTSLFNVLYKYWNKIMKFICIGYKEPVGKMISKSEADWIEQLSVVFALLSLQSRNLCMKLFDPISKSFFLLVPYSQ